MHICREPTVGAAREKHRGLLAEAIHKCDLKKSIARALAAICDLDDRGRHIDPGRRRTG